MKKYVLLCLLAGLSMNAMAEDYEDYKLDISGEVEAVIKSQDNFKTPFDYVDWGWATRGGASEKDSQFARVQGSVNFSSGTLGMSEYFGMLSLWADPQSTNDNVEIRKNQVGDTTWTQFEKNKVELTNAFVMWRPYAVKDDNGNLIGRPFGITVGNQSIPATINALNTNIFRGDIDGDFIAYSNTALLNKPGVHLDFHTGKFGVGYAYLKGSSDLLNNSAGYTNERSRTQVVYADTTLDKFSANMAYQKSEGNRKTIDTLSQIKTFFGDTTIADIDYDDYAYGGTAINMSFAYDISLGENHKLIPFVGYQKTDTEVAPDIIVETANKEYGSNFNIQKVEAEFTTVGAKFETKLFGKKVKISAEYSKCDTPSSSGFDLIYDGQLDYAVQSMFENSAVQSQLAAIDAMTGGMTSYAGTTYDMTDASFSGIAGNGNTTYTLAGLDAMGQLDVTIEMNENFDLTFFYKMAKSKDVDYEVSDDQKQELATKISTTCGMDSATAGALAENLAEQIEDTIKDGTRWDDYNSVGMSVVYRF